MAATVHWAGAGLSTSGPALRYLVERGRATGALDRLLLWGRDAGRLESRVAALGLSDLVASGAVGTALMAADGGVPEGVAAGDVVVSMLPGAEHRRLADAAVAAGAHFACTSYTSPELAAADTPARQAGVVLLTEAGLDPGIDHLLAHELIHRAREQVGERAEEVRFTSYCGGLAQEPGEFRYKFSWAPFGVLNALRSPATCVAGGEQITHTRPWTATTAWQVAGEGFEVYPNRDSLPFIEQYQVPAGWALEQFVRGTLRSQGWQQAWQPVFQTIESGTEQDLRQLAADLAQRYPTSGQDRDRVVLEVALELKSEGGTSGRWRGSARVDLTGDEEQSAMARCVTEPVAFGVLRILEGVLAPGLNRAVGDPVEVDGWLAHLRDRGIPVQVEVQEQVPDQGGAGSAP